MKLNEIDEAARIATRAKIDLIRSLGFVGNTHCCPGCMNELHADLGQHKPDCTLLADMLHDRTLDEDES